MFALLVLVLTSVGQAQPTTSDRLTLQAQIDKHAFISEAFFPWAHNAFNSSAYDYWLEPSQDTTITQQLDGGLRMIDMDMEWSLGYETIYLCHNGCSYSTDSTFLERLEELNDWFHPTDSALEAYRLANEVVILFLEAGNVEMGGQFDDAISDLNASGIGDRVYKPSSGTCETFDDLADVTKAEILAAEKNFIIVGADDVTCEEDGWKNWAFKTPGDHRVYHEVLWPTILNQFEGYPTCLNKYELFWVETTVDMASVTNFTHAYNDLWSIEPLESMSASQIETMVSCGVNAISREYYVPESATHEAHVWSWQPNEPNTGESSNQSCAKHTTAGLSDRQCTAEHRYACKHMSTGAWEVTNTDYGPWADGPQTCYEVFGLDYAFSMPANGYQANLMQDAKPFGSAQVWVNYSDRAEHGNWQPEDLFTEVHFDGTRHGRFHRTTLVDMSNDGATLTSDRFGVSHSAIELDRSQGDVIKGDYDLELGKNLTLSVWFKADTNINYTNGSRLVEISVDGNWGTGSGIYFNDGQVFASCTPEGATTRDGATSTSAIYEDGIWHHAAYVTDGSTAKLYIDGQLADQADTTCDDILDIEKIAIGRHYNSTTRGFDGVIDDVRINGVTLSVDDIQDLAADI